MLPGVVEVSASDHLQVDGELLRAFDLGKLPPTIVTDWAAALLDGDLPFHVSIDIEPMDVAWAKLRLDTRRNALESSAPTPGRTVALEQIAGLRMAYERRQTLPMRMTVTVVVRAPGMAALERRTKRLRQRARDLGADLRLLRWEQRAGWLAALPVRRTPLTPRAQPIDPKWVRQRHVRRGATFWLAFHTGPRCPSRGLDLVRLCAGATDGHMFRPRRRNQVTCSDRCRQRSHRLNEQP
jgi:hypothetical protein